MNQNLDLVFRPTVSRSSRVITALLFPYSCYTFRPGKLIERARADLFFVVINHVSSRILLVRCYPSRDRFKYQRADHVRFCISASRSNHLNAFRCDRCHCGSCLKAGGSIGSANVVVPKDKFKVSKGSPKIYVDKATTSGEPVDRHFWCVLSSYVSQNL